MGESASPGAAEAVGVILFRAEGIEPGFPCGTGTVMLRGGLLACSVMSVDRCDEVRGFIVVAPEVLQDEAANVARISPKFLGTVPAASTDWESVRAAVDAVPSGSETVLVHDGARPLASPDLFARVVQALDDADAVIPLTPIGDTLKRVEEGVVWETVSRESLGMVQTPQGFRRSALAMALRGKSRAGTSMEDLAFRAGLGVVTIPGEPGNIAVRTPDDLHFVEQLLAFRRAKTHGR
jgi:2-C-methyl-D-erythritol 4-phosphate cytidylyltransferase